MMRIDQEQLLAMASGTQNLARLHEFNCLPSRYIHPDQAAALLPAVWCDALEDGITPRLHAHLSSFILQKLQIANAWICDVSAFGTKLALLPRPLLESFVFRLGLCVFGKPIRQCVRPDSIRRLEADLNAQDWDYVFRAPDPGQAAVRGADTSLFTAPRQTLLHAGHLAVQRLVVELGEAVQTRLRLKFAPQSEPPAPLAQWCESVPLSTLEELSVHILDELAPNWNTHEVST